MIQNQRIKIMSRAKSNSSKHKAWMKRIAYVKYGAITTFYVIQAFMIPRWCLVDDSIADKTW